MLPSALRTATWSWLDNWQSRTSYHGDRSSLAASLYTPAFLREGGGGREGERGGEGVREREDGGGKERGEDDNL